MKEVKELYAENYKLLIKEIEGDLKKWKDSPYSWSRRIDIVNSLLKQGVFTETNTCGLIFLFWLAKN